MSKKYQFYNKWVQPNPQKTLTIKGEWQAVWKDEEILMEYDQEKSVVTYSVKGQWSVDVTETRMAQAYMKISNRIPSGSTQQIAYLITEQLRRDGVLPTPIEELVNF